MSDKRIYGTIVHQDNRGYKRKAIFFPDGISYEDLKDKPEINGVELDKDSTSSSLGLQDQLTFDEAPTVGSDNPVTSDGIKQAIDSIDTSGLTTEAKQLIISLFEKCAYVDNDAQNDINQLIQEFELIYLESITVQIQDQYSLFENDDVETVRNFITVTACYNDSSQIDVIDYQLSGSLQSPSSVITVTYQDQSTQFTVNVQSNNSIVFTQNEILRNKGTLQVYNDSTDDIPYCGARTDRMCYPYFDKLITPGTYDISITSTYSTVHIGLQLFTQHCLELVNNNEDFTAGTPSSPSIDMYDSGWITFTNGHATYTIPQMSNGVSGSEIIGVRLVFKQNSSGSNISSDFIISNVTLTKTS